MKKSENMCSSNHVDHGVEGRKVKIPDEIKELVLDQLYEFAYHPFKVEMVTEFDERLWHTLVDTVNVFSKEDIRFTIKMVLNSTSEIGFTTVIVEIYR